MYSVYAYRCACVIKREPFKRLQLSLRERVPPERYLIILRILRSREYSMIKISSFLVKTLKIEKNALYGKMY